MADFYFFTDLNLIGSYSTPLGGGYHGLEFGPAVRGNSGSYKDFNVSSIHYAAESDNAAGVDAVSAKNPAAYAVCDGQLFCIEVPDTIPGVVPENSGGKLVDIIFKPLVQPEKGPRVRYYIYRSVLMRSIVDGNGNILPAGSDFETDLTTAINAGKPAAMASAPVKGSIIGLHPNGLAAYTDSFDPTQALSDSSPVDAIFNKRHTNTIPTFLGEIKAGQKLGYFPRKQQFWPFSGPINAKARSMSYFGFEIVLEDPHYQPTIGQLRTRSAGTNDTDPFLQAREKAHIIEVARPNTTDPVFIEEHNKEATLHYLDTAAFYGGFAAPSKRDNLVAFGIAPSETTASRFVVCTGVNRADRAKEVYASVLVGKGRTAANPNFRNLNRVYVDLRNQFGYSLNLFEELGTTRHDGYLEDMAIDWGTGVIQPMCSRNKTRGHFPVLTLERFVVGPSDVYRMPEEVTVRDGAIAAKLRFRQLNDGTSAHYSALVVVGAFHRGTGSAQKVEDPSSRFTVLDHALGGGEVGPLEMLWSSVKPDPNKPWVAIAQYCRIVVLWHRDEIPATVPLTPHDAGYVHGPVPRLERYEYLDNLWCPFDLALSAQQLPPDGYVSSCYRESTYFDNLAGDGCDHLADIGIAFETTAAGAFYTLFVNSAEPRFGALNHSSALPAGLRAFSQPGAVSGAFLAGVARIANDLLGSTRQFAFITRGPDFIVDGLRNPVLRHIASIFTASPDGYDPMPFGFFALSFSATDWQTMRQTYLDAFTTSGTPNLRGFRTFLALVNDGFFKTGRTQYTRFKVYLRGFQVANGRVELRDVDTTVYYYLAHPGYDASGNDRIARLSGESEAGSAYRIRKDTYSTQAGPIVHQVIESRLAFARDMHMSWRDLIVFREHVRSIIAEVWSSTSNLGLWEITGIHGAPPYGPAAITAGAVASDPQIRADRPFSGSDGDIRITLACPGEYGWIPPGTALVAARKELRGRRSYVRRRRLACFYCQFPDARVNHPQRNAADLAKIHGNTFAHEFGHLLGLDDRYNSYGRVYVLNGRPQVADEPNAYPPSVFLPASVDPHYGVRYRWFFNLMAQMRGVPDDLSTLPFLHAGTSLLEAALTSEYNGYRPTARLSLNPALRQAVFVTQAQWQYVLDYRNESVDGSGSGFFRHLSADVPSPANVFNGSFVGFNGVIGDCTPLVTDDHATIGAAGEGAMAARINPAIRFHGWFKCDALTAMLDRTDDARTGGLQTLRRLIVDFSLALSTLPFDLAVDNPAEPPNAEDGDRYNIERIYQYYISEATWGPHTPCLANTSIHDPATVADRGKDLWELEDQQNLIDAGDPVSPSDDIRYDHHPNRAPIIELIGGSFDRP